jgi:hypothetical protein
MSYLTYAVLKAEVLIEADMEAEDFVQAAEVMTYFNDGIREACAHIQKLGLDDEYFNKSQTYDLVNGQTELALPTDIYATKITGLTYATASNIYPIKRMKGKDKSIQKQQILLYPSSGNSYQYDIENSNPTTGFKLKLYPASYETLTGCIVMDYVRSVTKITANTDLVDIPEFYSFIKAFVKYKLFDKENSQKSADTKADYEKETALMLETLREMTPDSDNLIPADFSCYEEHT